MDLLSLSEWWLVCPPAENDAIDRSLFSPRAVLTGFVVVPANGSAHAGHIKQLGRSIIRKVCDNEHTGSKALSVTSTPIRSLPF